MLRGAPPITPQCGFPNRKVAFCGFPNGKIANFRHLYPLFCQKTSIFGLVDSQTAYFGQIVDSQIGFWTNFQKWGVNDLEIPENLNMYVDKSGNMYHVAQSEPTQSNSLTSQYQVEILDFSTYF